MRPSWDEYYLGICEAASARSTCLRRKYGSIIVKEGRIVSSGFNGAPRGKPNCCDNNYCKREEMGAAPGTNYDSCLSAHAEANALLFCNRLDMIGATIYIAGVNTKDNTFACAKPCIMCERVILNAQIAKVIYRDSDGSIVTIDINKEGD